jgi:hypothetical protein
MEKSYSAEPQKNAVVKIANGLAESNFGDMAMCRDKLCALSFSTSNML